MRIVIFLLVGLALDGLIGPAQTARAQATAHSGTVITIVGAGSFNYSGDGGPATSAGFGGPNGLAISPGGALDFGDGREFSPSCTN